VSVGGGIIHVLNGILGSDNPQIRTYVNGALYALLQVRSVSGGPDARRLCVVASAAVYSFNVSACHYAAPVAGLG
jgi:hypothetical protein